MNYAILQASDGNFKVVSEHGENLEAAIVAFHTLCAALWNDEKTKRATVKLVDENLNVVMNMQESIGHDAPVEPAEDDDAENEPA
jgi:hypothetical protein